MDDAQQTFTALGRCPDDTIDLGRAALAISRLFQPQVNVAASVGELDLLAAAARAQVPAEGDLLDRVQRLNELLFGELGFAGERDDFYDPRNSFLDQVLARRRGIPISLSVLYCEVARRLGLPAHGVSFPAHFLVRVGRGNSTLVLDVYSGGIPLPEAELDRRLAEVYGEGAVTVRSYPSLLRPAGRRETLVRMLRNLAGIYAQRGDDANLLEALTAMLNLVPDLPDALHQRGTLLHKLGHAPAALTDLKRFAEVSDDAEQIAAVTPVIEALAQQPLRLH
ncbi:SirB1 family protein [uncultured Thiohalocapsa sp.]|uniref:SirB1 family protein n=1 Tax=uncultured Thiohalocapsa sp. TaxID=768990 RepID=UPI0025F5A7B4|nr:transglutaminase-like domain-containing protein [uncultured Thiohalocapsa sp.]